MREARARQLAVEYVEHGWPVARLAIPRHGVCPCRHGADCLDPHLLDGRVVEDPNEAAAAWSFKPWGIALVTARFDVIELPAAFGAPLHHRLKESCPTSIAPRTRRWSFFLTPFSVPASQLDPIGGRLRSGPKAWVTAPGTFTESHGRTRWLVPPYVTAWQAHQRTDAFDDILRP
ncbi:hypothetical protein [Kribbella deserti]|uniref:Bifunctional DNA primase/polymerase-like protein n=1 Tax=Kribbella deserti TaxID=1926257 RepID=A0ABV6QRH0_9ACTN